MEIPREQGGSASGQARRVTRRAALLGAAATAVLGAAVGGGVVAVSQQADRAESPAGAGQGAGERALMSARAVQAVIWGMPAVNYDRMLQAAIRVGGGANRIVYWSRLLDWHNQSLTPDPNAVYLMPFYDTTDGPMVLDIPPAAADSSITGSIDTVWQTPLADVGPAGIDKGRGGRYLLLPPGYNRPVPDGFIALRSETYAGFALLRSNPKTGSDTDVAAAAAYGKRVGLYPLAAAAKPPATPYDDASGQDFDATIPYNREFFTALDRQVQGGPWLARDMAMVDQLAAIGIRRGIDYQSDSQTLTLLDNAAEQARTWIEDRYVKSFTPSYYDNSRWAAPADPDLLTAMQNGYPDPGGYPVEARGVMYSFGCFAAKTPGSGQFYLMTIHDVDGRDLDGGSNYRLTVPAAAPVGLSWSVTAYDRATHALIREVDRAGRASNTPGLRPDPDGSVDLHFGPISPEGRRNNWIPTKSGQHFEVMFRCSGPRKPLLDKTWKLPDLIPT
ncbi:DUF1214 domain-containing protein [Nocardia vaccinii]|uniref:DUF1214 domain-containing protein n=1 Tax=Nocardia vaccinii TaxID=1822 RepID=UPI0009FD9C72|nr:DUF1254 domain-containing protein [Nocardia vaccinii]